MLSNKSKYHDSLLSGVHGISTQFSCPFFLVHKFFFWSSSLSPSFMFSSECHIFSCNVQWTIFSLWFYVILQNNKHKLYYGSYHKLRLLTSAGQFPIISNPNLISSLLFYNQAQTLLQFQELFYLTFALSKLCKYYLILLKLPFTFWTPLIIIFCACYTINISLHHFILCHFLLTKFLSDFFVPVSCQHKFSSFVLFPVSVHLSLFRK